MSRVIHFAEAIREAIDQSMAADPRVYMMGLGVPDPKAIFGTTAGLLTKYGPERVLDMPTAENGMTGVAIGSALVGMRPIMVHQRIDFALLAVEQLVNQAAKWRYMFGGRGGSVPLVVRLIVGRGWGQGAQHSQSLQSWFAHIPGLKVVMPTTPYDAKGLLMASIQDDDPVLFIEHRWLHGVTGPVPAEPYTVPLGQARVLREGKDLTIVALSYMSLEALRAAEHLATAGVSAEVIDLRCVRPLDEQAVLASVRKTGRLLAVDTGWKKAGVAAEIVALAVEQAFPALRSAPQRITLPDCPTPTTPALANHFYPRAREIVEAARRMCGVELPLPAPGDGPLDVPDPSFMGPF